jgi:hypothetical protein
VRLLPIRAATAILDLGEDAVLRQIEEGQLLWAFNVALRKDCRAKELRIFPQCVGDSLAGRESRIQFEDVVQALTRGERDTMPASEVAAGINCSSTQIYNLIRSGQLKVRGGWRTGPGGSARVSVASFVKFLGLSAYPVPVSEP